MTVEEHAVVYSVQVSESHSLIVSVAWQAEIVTGSGGVSAHATLTAHDASAHVDQDRCHGVFDPVLVFENGRCHCHPGHGVHSGACAIQVYLSLSDGDGDRLRFQMQRNDDPCVASPAGDHH